MDPRTSFISRPRASTNNAPSASGNAMNVNLQSGPTDENASFKILQEAKNREAYYAQLEHGPNNKVELIFNDRGQPCGLKTSRLTNFIGSLVKGKEVTLAAPNWTKVPVSEKDKLWRTVKAFFEVDDVHKRWVFKSASKKWRAFKSFLKRTYFKAKLTTKQNIDNGCEDRILPNQWKWLVRHWKSPKAVEWAKKNKETRENQENCCHAAGSRSFAVVQDQMELKEGRSVSRTELYCVVHTNKDGKPIDAFSAKKMNDIKTHFESHPEARSEPASDKDYYSTLFPKAKTARGHGLGLLVYGKSSEHMSEALQALRESREENLHLREVVETLISKSQEMEKKVNFLLQSQSQKPNHEAPMEEAKKEEMPDEEEVNNAKKEEKTDGEKIDAKEVNYAKKEEMPDGVKVDAKEVKQDKRERMSDHEPILDSQKKRISSESGITYAVQESKSENQMKRMRADSGLTYAVKESQSNSQKISSNALQKFHGQEDAKFKQVKIEKIKEIKRIQGGAVSNTIRPRKIVTIKKGMEVGLTSPNSSQLVALGTVQNIEDGDYIEVLVNVVLNSTTALPKAYGRVTVMGNAQSLCIPWPKNHVKKPDLTPKSVKLISDMDGNLRVHSKPRSISSQKDSEIQRVKQGKKRRLINGTMKESQKMDDSQVSAT